MPERVFESTPASPTAVAALVACEALCLAFAAASESPWPVLTALAGKLAGPLAFLAAVRWGWESRSSWPWVLVNDCAWVAPLAIAWRRRRGR